MLPLGTNFSKILVRIQNISFTENASENIVCEMAVILSRGDELNLLLSGYHYIDGIMNAMASQITSLTIVESSVYSGVDQSKHRSSTSLAFVGGIHRWIPAQKEEQ